MVDAIEQLIADNMGLVYKQLHKFDRINDQDAYSCALESLLRAAQTYKPSKNIKFSTYASVCIYNGIANYLRGIKRSAKLQVASLDEPIADDVCLGDAVCSDESVEDACLISERNKILWQAFDSVLKTFSNPVERSIIEAWRDTDFTCTQADLATTIGVSQPHVSRALSAFKYRLKKEMEDYLC